MMKCLSCGRALSDAFFTDLAKSVEFKGGRFACPHCGAEHIRRKIGELPSGAPLYTLRLWGHPLAKRRQPPSPGKEGKDRRKHPRQRPR
ncbi:MAG TPA: hypothetical protein VMU54_08085 [Planctomycetota bacterium]|nr:hypothetical protein [Planctomycetota bacterium]